MTYTGQFSIIWSSDDAMIILPSDSVIRDGDT